MAAEATSTLYQALQPHNNLDAIKDRKRLCGLTWIAVYDRGRDLSATDA
jgi:hypothetical protein